MSDLVLTDDQQAAYNAFSAFIVSPDETTFVLEGYAGTGKSTLVNKFLEDLDSTLKLGQLITGEEIDWNMQLTATTNKACEALREITKRPVVTIQSFLGLVLRQHPETRENYLDLRNDAEEITRTIIFIDEAGFMDDVLIKWVAERCHKCKLVFIGDPAQLAAVKSTVTPIFSAGYFTARLSEVVRQAKGNPIMQLATNFRHTVTDGEWRKFIPDGVSIIHLDKDDFHNAIIAEFQRPDYKKDDAKVLAWTNAAVTGYNKTIRAKIQGVPHLEAGDYAVCNQYFRNRNGSIKTDETVQIESISAANEYGIPGWYVVILLGFKAINAFLPASIKDKQQVIKAATENEEHGQKILNHIDNHWIDLRAAYACTVNKSQGSTYNKAFIDLSDIGKCNNWNTLARMMYVAVSRARHQVIFTGDIG